jgi:hypothetical protein
MKGRSSTSVAPGTPSLARKRGGSFHGSVVMDVQKVMELKAAMGSQNADAAAPVADDLKPQRFDFESELKESAARIVDNLFVDHVLCLIEVPKVRATSFDLGPDPLSDEWSRLDTSAKDACHWFRSPYVQVVLEERRKGKVPQFGTITTTSVGGSELSGQYEGAAEESSSSTSSLQQQLAQDSVSFENFRVVSESALEEYERTRCSQREEILFAELGSHYASSATSSMEQLLGCRMPAQKDPNTLKTLNVGSEYATRFMVKPKAFSVGAQQSEPFFFKLAVYDATSMTKVSEDVSFDLNSPALRNMVPSLARQTPHKVLSALQFVLTVAPSTSLYLVVQAMKIPNIGALDDFSAYTSGTPASLDKLKSSSSENCFRYGMFSQLFAWSALRLFNDAGGFLAEVITTRFFVIFFSFKTLNLNN